MDITEPIRHPCPRSQRGAAGVGIALLILLILAAALTTALSMSGSAVRDAAMSEEQIAALFMAESGVERAQAIISLAAQGGSYTNTTCTGLQDATGKTLGRGTFRIPAPPTCSGADPCAECNVVVEGEIGDSVRKIRTTIATTNTAGAADCSHSPSNPALGFLKPDGYTAVFSNLAYRAKNNNPQTCSSGSAGGPNADVNLCSRIFGGTNIGACNAPPDGWNLQSTGINNVGGMGVFSTVDTTANTYRIEQTLYEGSNSAQRSYVQVGVVFAPLGNPPVARVGSYAANTGPNKTVDTAQTTGSIPNGWNCAASSGSTAASVAAAADTLVYGFSLWSPSSGPSPSGVTVAAAEQPLRLQQSMTSGTSPSGKLYSQIWYAYNNAYYPGLTITASNGGSFTGTIGALTRFRASTATTGGSCTTALCLVLRENLSGGQILSIGDTITGSDCDSTPKCTLGALLTAAGTANLNGAVYALTYTNGAAPNISNRDLRADSSVMNAPTPPTGGLSVGDAVTDGASTTYGYIGSGNVAPRYNLVDASGNAITQMQMVSPTFRSSSKKITFSAAAAIPLAGTAIAVSSSLNGAFGTTTVTGDVTPKTTDSTLTVTSGSGLQRGDALFGTNIKPNTRITVVVSATIFTISNVQPTSSGSTIVAKAGVNDLLGGAANPIATVFYVSRLPTTPLNGASICGGVCAMLNHGSSTGFSLLGINKGDDWASGFACLSGVDPANIPSTGIVSTRRSSWSEPVN